MPFLSAIVMEAHFSFNYSGGADSSTVTWEQFT